MKDVPLVRAVGIEIFAGCVFDSKGMKINVPGFGWLDRKRFDVVFGGRVFILTDDNEKVTRSAWDAYHFWVTQGK